MQHSIVPPSGAPFFVACALWILGKEDYEDKETELSRQGEAAHFVIESVVNSWLVQGASIITSLSQLPERAPNGVYLDQYMMDGAQMFTNYVLKLCNELGCLRSVRVEETINIPSIHPKCFGTPDLWFYDANTKTLYVIDYKYGFVLVLSYYQHTCYAEGIIKLYNLDVETIVLTTVQPRSPTPRGLIRSKTLNRKSFDDDVNMIRGKVLESFSPDRSGTAGNHCFNCVMRSDCEVFNASTMNALTVVGQTNFEQPDGEQLGIRIKELRQAQAIIDSMLKNDEEVAIDRIKKGQVIKYFGLDSGKSTRKITPQFQDDVIELGGLYKVETYTKKCKTFKQCVDAGIPREDLLAFSETVPGTLKLVDENETKAGILFNSEEGNK